MAEAKKRDLLIEVGEVRRWRNRLAVDGVFLTNLDGFEATVRFGPAPLPSQPIQRATVELSTADGTIQRDGAYFRWTLNDGDSRQVVSGIWQMMVTPPSGKATRIYEGVVRVSRELRGKNG